MPDPSLSRIPLIIGVTGHRDPLEPEKLAGELRGLFRGLDRMAPHTPIVLLSPLAEGADQLFAEVGLEVLEGRPAGAELVAVLPFRLADYRCDFLSAPGALARFDALHARATATLELPPRSEDDLVDWTSPAGGTVRRVGRLPDVDGSAVRALHYDRLGRFMAVHAHAMVAVWNGWNPPRAGDRATMVGGTASVVAFCRDGGATGREGGTPLREDIPSILDNPRIPVFRFAVGALVDVEVRGTRALREVIAGSCYKSQSTMLVHAGLGDADVADRVTVRWPRVGAVREERVLVNVPSGLVVPVYPPSRIGDAAGDGRVDPADMAACDACTGGDFSAACAVFDANGDCRVTQSDRDFVAGRLCDLDRDGLVGASDLAILLGGWGRPESDLTGDGAVGAEDLALLLARW